MVGTQHRECVWYDWIGHLWIIKIVNVYFPTISYFFKERVCGRKVCVCVCAGIDKTSYHREYKRYERHCGEKYLFHPIPRLSVFLSPCNVTYITTLLCFLIYFSPLFTQGSILKSIWCTYKIFPYPNTNSSLILLYRWLAAWYYTVWMYHSLVHQSSIDGLWRDFQPSTVTNNSAMNNHVCDVISQISVDMSLLQNDQDNSAPKNEVIVEGHGKLPWLERTTWVQKLSPDVILQFSHFHLFIGQMCSLEASNCQKLDTEITYHK